MTAKAFPLPVRMVGAGSQPAEDEALQCLDFPRDVSTFSMPGVPEVRDVASLERARDLLAGYCDRLAEWDPAAHWQGPRLDLAGVPPEVLAVLNPMLGEGEVSIQVGGERRFRIQESVFAGVWRVCALGGEGALESDWIEAAPLPQAVVEAAYAAAGDALPEVALPQGVMNAPSLLAEIRAQMATRTPGAPAHVVNLTLFPMTPEDHQVMQASVPVGPVAMISRGFGNCRITSTLLRGVWRVQYFNSMNTLILNTIEVVDVPEVALAAAEDLEDSKSRLAELVAWMDESYAEQAG
jgi:hydrogenase-1 operon protein HyaF